MEHESFKDAFPIETQDFPVYFVGFFHKPMKFRPGLGTWTHHGVFWWFNRLGEKDIDKACFWKRKLPICFSSSNTANFIHTCHSKNHVDFSKKIRGGSPRIPFYHINNEVLKNPMLRFWVFGATNLCFPKKKGHPQNPRLQVEETTKVILMLMETWHGKGLSERKDPGPRWAFSPEWKKKKQKRWCVKFAVCLNPGSKVIINNDLYFTERCSLLAPVSICLPIIAEISSNFILGVCLPVKFTSKKIPRNEIQWVNPLFTDHQRVEFCGFVSRDLCLRQHKTKT